MSGMHLGRAAILVILLVAGGACTRPSVEAGDPLDAFVEHRERRILRISASREHGERPPPGRSRRRSFAGVGAV
jgi:hypothetical protein